MNKTVKAIVWIIVLLLVIWGISALTGKKDEPVSEGPIKIGFISPLTGDAAVYGEPARNTVELAVEEINAAGGINGQQIQLVYEDDECTGPTAVSAVQKLVDVDKVQIILGSMCSGATIPSVPIAAKSGVTIFSFGASSPDLTGISKFFARDYPSDATQGKVLAELANKQGWQTVAVIQEQTEYATGLYGAFDESFKLLGGKTLNEAFPTNTSDFRSILTKLKDQNPDALFLSVQTAASGERILKQLGELNWKPKLLLSDSFAGDSVTIKNNAVSLEGAYAAEFIPDLSNLKLQNLVTSYTTKYNVEEVPYLGYMATTYDAVYLVRDGLIAGGNDGEKFAEWIRTVKGWQGASGVVTMEESGDRSSGHKAEVVKNGKIEPYQQ
ncbi:MAG: ABC transporter substrate-binding protein [Patescibacteria group bacterium]